jgi:hypothetical protein
LINAAGVCFGYLEAKALFASLAIPFEDLLSLESLLLDSLLFKKLFLEAEFFRKCLNGSVSEIDFTEN